MATNIQNTLRDPLYMNWVKAGLVLKYTKHGIEHFVDSAVDTFQKRCLFDIYKSKGIPAGSICSNCDTRNVLPCRTTGICTGRKVCTYHGQYQHTQCPNQICNGFRDKIIQNHRLNAPSWRNTDAHQWCSNRWEIAKCYMTQRGYKDVQSASDTDLPGLLHVVLNLTDFQQNVTDNLLRQNNLFRQALDIRNKILHTSSYHLSDQELNAYINTMTLLLSDSNHLATDANARDAIDKLDQIKTGSLSITDEDDNSLRNEALKAIEEKKEEALYEVYIAGEVQVKQLDDRQQKHMEVNAELAQQRDDRQQEHMQENEMRQLEHMQENEMRQHKHRQENEELAKQLDKQLYDRQQQHMKVNAELMKEFKNEMVETKELDGKDVRRVNSDMYYFADRKLGYGSSAEVFEGRFGNTGKKTKAAVKVIKIENHSSSKNEVDILTKIESVNHPNVVRFYGHNYNDDRLYIALEFCDGTLNAYVKNNNWQKSFEAPKVIQSMANGLSFLHDNDIVHRDLKPENIFVVLEEDAVRKVVLGDFGTAKCTPNTLYSMTGYRGTHGYFAAEAYDAILRLETDEEIRPCLSSRSDIFSLGLLFYFVYTSGNNPYGNNPMAGQQNIFNRNPPTLNGIMQNVDICKLLKKMLSHNPEERPTATDVCAQMARWPQ